MLDDIDMAEEHLVREDEEENLAQIEKTTEEEKSDKGDNFADANAEAVRDENANPEAAASANAEAKTEVTWIRSEIGDNQDENGRENRKWNKK